MKISIVTGPWFPVPTLQGGAVPRLWQGLAEQFVAMGHQVTIVCRSYPSQPQQEILNGVKYFRYSGFPQSRSIAWDLLKDLAYALLVLLVLPRADILVINDFWLPVFASTLRPDAGRVVINAARFPKGQYHLYAGADRFVAPSKAIQEAIAKQYPTANSRLRVIPNPIDTSVFYPPVSPRPTRKDKTILYAGRIHPEKGIHLLLDAFAILCQQFPDVKLRILGPSRQNQGGGGEDYLHSLKIKAQELPVEFSEPIFEGKKLAEAYRTADLFCYPSLAEKGESFGVAPLEAMATGLVPIVSNLDCFRDFIEEGKTGYFFDHRSPNAAKTLSSTLTSALLNHKATGEMAIQASQNATCFSYENIAKLYLAEFEELLK
ncbi:glycosyltransferase family 4 protein [Coleofasciculus sp. G2-EDA-02]|uniref:glycosyltransferase family 4 protein n=1 Tax=Coleofasciculus sp. G2-EDA-02 TaxID=3069529 RepID=UPI0032F20CA7